MIGHDHCRIGSLENESKKIKINTDDHCRIGSLEIDTFYFFVPYRDHCRIGSLEMRRLKLSLI